MGITFNPLDEMTYPYITDLSYKGFHPFEKKKIIKKINLLIAKFNKINNDLYNKGNDILKKEIGDDKFKELLKSNHLDAYRGITLAYQADLSIEAQKKLPSMLIKRRNNFGIFINLLTKSGHKLKDINTSIERDEYWNCCKGNDPKSLKFTNKYNTTSNNFEREFKSKIQTNVANTLNKITKYLLFKENEKIGESKTFLEKLNKYLESKKNNYKNNEEAKTIIENLEAAFKKLINILNNKKGSLAKDELNIIEGYINLARVPKEIETPSDKSYFLPMINCDDDTKKIILKVMSAQTDSAGYTILTQKISEYIKNNSKK